MPQELPSLGTTYTTMATAPIQLSFDVILMLAPYLREPDVLNLGMTRRDLNGPLTRYAIQKALVVPFDTMPKHLLYAIDKGDIQLLSRIYDCIDSTPPQPWRWPHSHSDGTCRILRFATSCSEKSLQFLVQRFPLWAGPADDSVPKAVLDHGFYSSGSSPYNAARANIENKSLVNLALDCSQYRCASFLLNYNSPPLFPDAFDARYTRECYASATGLRLLIDHGARLDDNPLHVAAQMDLRDPGVFAVLVQAGYGVDSPFPSDAVAFPWIGLTPLCVACDSFISENVEALLGLGADPNGRGFEIIKHQALGPVYFSPNPLLSLLFSLNLTVVGMDYKFMTCFQLLLRYGATTSIPFPDGDIFEIFLLRVWDLIVFFLHERVRMDLGDYMPGEGPNKYPDVSTLISCVSKNNFAPLDEYTRIVHEAVRGPVGNSGQTTDRQLLEEFLRDYQARRGDLRDSRHEFRFGLTFVPPERFLAQRDAAS